MALTTEIFNDSNTFIANNIDYIATLIDQMAKKNKKQKSSAGNKSNKDWSDNH
jgi:hypothetical protein